MLFALEHRHRLRTERITAKVLTEGPPTPRSILRACLVEILPASADRAAEAAVLWAIADSQGSEILMGHRTPAEAESTVDYHLGRLCTG